MVVAHAIFVASQRPGGLNAPDKPLFHERPQCVVDSLPRNGADFGANFFGDFISRAMRPPRNGTHDRQSLCGDLKAVVSEGLGWIFDPHGRDITDYLDSVNNLCKSK